MQWTTLTGSRLTGSPALGVAACLVIERRTWSADNPITHVRLIYPGDSHRLVARFAPSSG